MIKVHHAIAVNILALLIITGYFDNMLDTTHERIFELEKKLEENSQSPWGTLEFDVTVTMYNPAKSQTDSTPNETADGTIINPKKASEYRYVALSRDLIARWGGPFNYGDYVMLKGTNGYDGVYQVRDTMNPRFVNRIDILESVNVKPYKFVDAKIIKTNMVIDKLN